MVVELILAAPVILNPVPPNILPLTPNPPVTCNDPEVEDVEFVLSATNIVLTNNVFPIYEVPAMPTPPVTINPPEDEDVAAVAEAKVVIPLNVLAPAKVCVPVVTVPEEPVPAAGILKV